MAARKKKRSCKFGRRKDGKCRKRPRGRRRAGKRRTGKTCKFVRISGRKQRMCKRGRRWLFAA